MVFVLIDSVDTKKVALVKGDSKIEIEERIKLKETESLVGSFTASEISALDSSSFAIIQG